MSAVNGFLDAVKATRNGVAKVETIKALLTQIGSATSGTKDVLLKRFSQQMQKRDMPVKHANAAKLRRTRILSIDMGIKNLAYCVADVTTDSVVNSCRMNVVAWRRLDVEKEVSQQISRGASGKQEVEDVIEPEASDPYTPWTLANTAYALLTNTLLAYKPEIILIERQRWRSAGGPSIQQWTVRVNTLEGMLWAILTALRADSASKHSIIGKKDIDRDYEIFGVDPKRVGNFWVGDEVRALVKQKPKPASNAATSEKAEAPRKRVTQRLSRGKVEKKNKIDLVRTWLMAKDPSTMLLAPSSEGAKSNESIHSRNSQTAIHFSFEGEAEATRQALCTEVGGNGRRKATGLDTKKLDDVADCFLQASAFVAWEQNKKAIQDVIVQIDAMPVERDHAVTKEKVFGKEKKTRKRGARKE